MPVKVGLVSLGCPKNLVDSEVMLGLIKNAGYEITGREREAEVLIVNTCSFINDAKEESIKTILELARHKEKGRCRAVLVAGCLAQRYHEELLGEMPEVDGIIGTGSVSRMPEVIRRVLHGERVKLVESPGYLHTGESPRVQATPGYTAYLKIAEGCDNFCAYCTIPQVRGPYRSRNPQDVLHEAAAMAKTGVKEIILVAQDTTRYGSDLAESITLAGLLAQLVKIEGIEWFRLMYTYPSLFTDELIEIISSSSKVCRYLDLPLQHASESVLRRMKRPWKSIDTTNLLEKLRTSIPGIALRTSFIVGFPGETEEEFQELLDFMREVRFDHVGIFTYSREEGTSASELPGQLPEEVKQERKDRAMTLQQQISLVRNTAKIGQSIVVLVETPDHTRQGIYVGRGEGDAPDIDGRVYFHSEKRLEPGAFVKVFVKEAREYDLIGELTI